MLLMGKMTNRARKKAKQGSPQLKNPMLLLKSLNKTEEELLLSQRGNIPMATKQLKNRSGGVYLRRNSGITLDQNGQAVNAGGNLRITKESEGGTSVGGKIGIDVAPNGQMTVAGSERASMGD
jgi:hypothetical protein